jgi:hypothetical protein
MTTEQEIIYTIWDVIRAGESNSDDPINERLMRRFLQGHRGKLLNSYYKKGATISDECFQSLGTITFTISTSGEWQSPVLPKIIRFKHRHGLIMTKDNLIVAVMNSEEYHNAHKDRYNKFQPRLKFINRILTIDIGQEQICNQIETLTDSVLNTAVRKLQGEVKSNSITLTGLGVLVNPDDEVGYDWLSSPYPMPDELIENLVNSVNARDFGIFLKMRADETGDIRSNVAEYNTREEL